jgi:type IV pilus assembly protein PilA
MKREVMKNNKGFSLVELIVVIAIMAVLMAVLAPALLRYVEKSRAQKDASAASEVANAVEIALSVDDIYNKVAGADEIKVTYAGSDGTVTVESTNGLTDDAKTALENEIYTTLKAENGKIAAAASKTYKSDTFTVTAKYEPAKTTYTVTSAWNSASSAAAGN